MKGSLVWKSIFTSSHSLSNGYMCLPEGCAVSILLTSLNQYPSCTKPPPQADECNKVNTYLFQGIVFLTGWEGKIKRNSDTVYNTTPVSVLSVARLACARQHCKEAVTRQGIINKLISSI
jgi:hypothetical protein